MSQVKSIFLIGGVSLLAIGGALSSYLVFKTVQVRKQFRENAEAADIRLVTEEEIENSYLPVYGLGPWERMIMSFEQLLPESK